MKKLSLIVIICIIVLFHTCTAWSADIPDTAGIRKDCRPLIPARGSAMEILPNRNRQLPDLRDVFSPLLCCSDSVTGLILRPFDRRWVYVERGVFRNQTGLARKYTDRTWEYILNGYPTDDYTQMILTEKDDAAGLKGIFCQIYARCVVRQITDDSMSVSEKLLTSFLYTVNTFQSTGNPRIPHMKSHNWVQVYAYDMFGPSHGGNCLSFAAAFAYLAKACGCRDVYACNSGFHAWTEADGLVYDTEQYHDTENKIYAYSYDDPLISNYWDAISEWPSNAWMRVRITFFH